MIDEFLDWRKLYPLVRAVRAVNKAFCAGSFWQQEYEEEERNGLAIKQREKRLTDERADTLKTKLHGCSGDENAPRNFIASMRHYFKRAMHIKLTSKRCNNYC